MAADQELTIDTLAALRECTAAVLRMCLHQRCEVGCNSIVLKFGAHSCLARRHSGQMFRAWPLEQWLLACRHSFDIQKNILVFTFKIHLRISCFYSVTACPPFPPAFSLDSQSFIHSFIHARTHYISLHFTCPSYIIQFVIHLSSQLKSNRVIFSYKCKSAHTALAVKACLLGCKQPH